MVRHSKAGSSAQWLTWAWVLGAASPAWAVNPLVVTTTADTVAMDRACSLREAITAINTGATVNECVVSPLAPSTDITFSLGTSAATILVTSPITLQAPMTITGQGEALTHLDGRGLNGIFNVAGAVTVHLNALTLQHSYAAPASASSAIHNAGSVYLDSVTCQDSFRAQGGACLVNAAAAGSSANATITNSTFLRNSADLTGRGAPGGAISNAGMLVVTGSIFQENTAPSGGAVATTTPTGRATSAAFTQSTFLSNSATGPGGALATADGQPLTLNKVVMRLNQSSGGAGGGAIAAHGLVTITDSQLAHNSAAGDGGAILAGPASTGTAQRLVLRRTSLTDNAAAGHGGGVFAGTGETVLASNVTLVNNTANGNGGGLAGQANNTLRLSNVTVTGNQANALWNDAGTGGGVFQDSGLFTLQNSVVAGNLDNNASLPGPDCRAVAGAAAPGGVVSGGYNLLGDSAGCARSGSTLYDVVGQDPGFTGLRAGSGPLAGWGNGERLLVEVPPPGSLLINGGNPSGCTEDDGSTAPPALTTDAQGSARLLRCDVGAVETTCGNALQDPGEACDDGDLNNLNACTSTCTLHRCGDGFRYVDGEQCDLGTLNSDTGRCTTACQNARCGDGLVQAGVEQCDDGNGTDGDGCNHLCQWESTSSSQGGLSSSSSGPVASSSSGMTVSSSGAAGSSSSVLPCDPPTLAQCNGAAFADTACGRQALQNNACEVQCNLALEGVTVAQCESTWLSSVCGKQEAARWAAAVNQGNLALSRCATLKATLTGDGGVEMLNPPVNTLSTVLQPMSLVHGDGQVEDVAPRTRDQSHKFPYTPSRLMHSGGSSTFRGWRTHQALRAAGDNPNFPAMDTLADAVFKAGMNANGKRVDSCREYVYEKYWNFSRWEDETQSAGNLWRIYFDKAYATSNTLPWHGINVYPVSAIGTLGEAGIPLKSRDGTALAKQVEFGNDNTAKNIFFTLGPPSPSGGQTSIFAETIQQVLGDRWSSLPLCGGSWSPDYLLLCDQDLAAKVWDGVTNHKVPNRGWAYHHLKSDAVRAAGWTDEDLYVSDGLKARYEQLLRQHGEILGMIWAILSAPAHRRFLPEGTQLPDALNSPDPAWSQIETMRDRMDVGGIQTSQVMSVDLANAGAAAKLDLASALNYGLGGLTPSLGTIQAGVLANIQASTQGHGAAYPMSAHHSYGSSQSPEMVSGVIMAGGQVFRVAPDLNAFADDLWGLTMQLTVVDALLEEALHEADALSCLDPSDGNPCDWSPRDFAQAVVGYYAADQEADYQRCVRNTSGGNFSTVKGRMMRLVTKGTGGHPDSYQYPELRGIEDKADGTSELVTYPCVLDPKGKLHRDSKPDKGDGFTFTCPDPVTHKECNQWNMDTTHLDTYFQCVDQFKVIVAKSLEKLGDLMDEKGHIRLSQSTGENEQAGNDDFNLHYGYGFGWAMGGFEDYVKPGTGQYNACKLHPEMYAHINAGATAFHHSIELVEGSGHVNTGATSGFSNLSSLGVVANTLEFKVLGMDLFEPVATNVHVSADIVKDQDEKSKDFLTVTVPFALGPIPMSLTGGITGRLGVKYGATVNFDTQDACNSRISGYFTPYAGVDGFAAVGIDILVAAAGVKITLTIIQADLPFTVSVGLASVDGSPGITFDTNLDLVLSTLGGRISVYLRILFASWDWTIFSWEGFKKTMNLFHAQMDIQLLPLQLILGDLAAKQVQ